MRGERELRFLKDCVDRQADASSYLSTQEWFRLRVRVDEPFAENGREGHVVELIRDDLSIEPNQMCSEYHASPGPLQSAYWPYINKY